MKKKETLSILKYFQKWRRGGEGDQPDPKILGKALDNAIATLEAKGGYIDYENTYQKKYEEENKIVSSAVGELQFANLQIEYLYSVIDEIEEMTNDKLIKMACKNAKERSQLKKLIHSRKLFK